MEFPHFQNPNKLWIDVTHYIRWVTFEGERIGGILGHTSPGNIYPPNWCEGAFYFEGNAFFKKHPRDGDVWNFNGDFEKPTLAPSFLCHCKTCHIFIREGRRVDAGCSHG